MSPRTRQTPSSFPAERILLVLSIAFVGACVIVVADKYRRGEFAEAEESAIAHGGEGAGRGDENTQTEDAAQVADDEALEEESDARNGWPRVDRDRLRYGLVQDVSNAFALGRHSGLVALSSESEQILFDEWCERAAAWPDSWNRDPVLFADGKDRTGASVYRIELHGRELGRLHLQRFANGWNIVGVERRLTRADLEAERRILHEAATRAGVVRKRADANASTGTQ